MCLGVTERNKLSCVGFCSEKKKKQADKLLKAIKQHYEQEKDKQEEVKEDKQEEMKEDKQEEEVKEEVTLPCSRLTLTMHFSCLFLSSNRRVVMSSRHRRRTLLLSKKTTMRHQTVLGQMKKFPARLCL